MFSLLRGFSIQKLVCVGIQFILDASKFNISEYTLLDVVGFSSLLACASAVV